MGRLRRGLRLEYGRHAVGSLHMAVDGVAHVLEGALLRGDRRLLPACRQHGERAARGALLPLAEGLLSPLAGVVLCVSGISFRADEREWVEAAVENAGGRFSRVLDASTTHLMTSGGHDGGAKDEALLALSAVVSVMRVTPMW